MRRRGINELIITQARYRSSDLLPDKLRRKERSGHIRKYSKVYKRTTHSERERGSEDNSAIVPTIEDEG